ncbi:molybdopterin molybdotransferase MoeA [Methyloradius palustris]|uniref:Molybdopterin molybdenumtransferase n=1 Tax=Methyloradius palustris TaxID=2778876 RepID=A0A8D5G0X6_9PROT|nr:gephyrin-like molybdotransferase Glp [Methyloradius palustris]BCM25924.1 molybdopterin molybdenumtransferase MoeA [Methyloradius palustris]
MNEKSISDLVNSPNSMEDYDPNSMPVQQARQYIRDYLNPVTTTKTLSLRETLGRILAEDILSTANVPNYDNSAMDGYVFNADDQNASGETRLKIAGDAFAGNGFTGSLQRGECVRIMTGGAIPAGADTVIPQEYIKIDGGDIVFAEPLKQGRNVRYAGEDLKLGQVVLSKGHMIHAADLGLIASLGIGEIKVYRKLRVAIFSTGDELASVRQALNIGQVYDSNRYTLYGMLTRLGVDIIDLGAVKDDPKLLEQTLAKAAEQADIIITSGGVSVGAADHMKALLKKLGQVVFWKIAMKPGRPLAYGKVGNAHYFGLPGNPVAVMVTFYQFVRDALLFMMGQPTPKQQPLLSVICTSGIKKLKGRTEFQRGILFTDTDSHWKVKTTGNQGSAILSSMSAANCFIVLDEETGNLDAGSTVQVQLLEGII